MNQLKVTHKTHSRLRGKVISTKMNKTVNVLIQRKVPDPKYGKYVTRRTKLLAHDEKNACMLGDVVLIQESRPISKRKNWIVIEIAGKDTVILTGENKE